MVHIYMHDGVCVVKYYLLLLLFLLLLRGDVVLSNVGQSLLAYISQLGQKFGLINYITYNRFTNNLTPWANNQARDRRRIE